MQRSNKDKVPLFQNLSMPQFRAVSAQSSPKTVLDMDNIITFRSTQTSVKNSNLPSGRYGMGASSAMGGNFATGSNFVVKSMDSMNLKPLTTSCTEGYVDSCAPLLEEASINYYRAFKTKCSIKEMRAEFIDSCQKNDIRDIEILNDFCIEGRYFDKNHKMAMFYAGIYTLDSTEEDATIMEINRGTGCSETFQAFIVLIIQEFREKNLIIYTKIKSDKNGCFSIGWKPLPLPMLPLGRSDSGEFESPLFTGLSELPPIPQLTDLSDSESQLSIVDHVSDLFETCQTGYACEIQEAAPLFALESQKPQSCFAIQQIHNFIEKWKNIVEASYNALLIRCMIISIKNLILTIPEMQDQVIAQNVSVILQEIKKRWSVPQQPYGQLDEQIMKSVEIVSQVTKVLDILC